MADTPYIESDETKEARIALMMANEPRYAELCKRIDLANGLLKKLYFTPGSQGSSALEHAEQAVRYALLDREQFVELYELADRLKVTTTTVPA